MERRIQALGQVEDALTSALQALSKSRVDLGPVIAVWRLTLECGHLRLDGPWDAAEPQRHMIGDMTWCEVCPRRDTPQGKTMLVRQVVNVEQVPSGQYREPDERADAERREGLGLR
jgi:hypothetical protein